MLSCEQLSVRPLQKSVSRVQMVNGFPGRRMTSAALDARSGTHACLVW